MDKEIVIVMGYNAAGKSTLVEEFVQQGYQRLNRDTMGGSLDGQAKVAEAHIVNDGTTKLVLDNTYADVESRKSIIAVGQRHNIPVRCVWLATSFEDAQLNACLRMIEKTGQLLMPEDFSGKYKGDPNLFPPVALFAYKKRFQKPTTAEGFSAIDKREFVRVWPQRFTRKALLLDYDDTLRTSTGAKQWPEDPSEVKLLPGRKEVLTKFSDDEYLLLGVSNQSAIAKGLPLDMAVACFERTNELLGHRIEYVFCPHSIPPVKCFCRKPHPGLGAWLIHKHWLDPSQCIMVGDQTSDQTFAKRCGFQYEDADSFFGG